MPRSSSSSSSSSSSKSSSPDSRERRLLERLERERIKLKEKKKKEKELLKATESLEEKRIRRLVKKEMKERKRKERMGWDNDYLHYTNTDNPFGDSNLLSTFVWNKKLAKEGFTGVTREEIEARNRLKMEENKRELEKVKKRRLERELERQRREEEMSRLQRSKEATQFQEWEQQEDQFHLDQARLRSQIRIQDGRAKPIDLLAKYIGSEKNLDAVEVHEPYTYLNGLSINDLEDLVADIKVYTELEKGKNLDYWNDITLIVQDELQKLRKKEMEKKNDRPVFRDSINPSVSNDIVTVFKGKTAEQLEEIQKQITKKIASSAEGTDLSYWESLLILLKAHMARVRLRDRHQKNLKEKLEYLKQEQKVSNADSRTATGYYSYSTNSNKSSTSHKNSSRSKSENENYSISKEYEKELMENAKSAAYEILSEELDEYDAGMYSPEYIGTDELEPATIIVTEEDDAKRLEFDRLQVLGNGSTAIDTLSAEEKRLHNEARKGMTNEEAEFSVESVLDNQIYLWSDKYRPRKPRYFNRVHTGFEWNKYNQTHYDMDNPPPKIVQGYKFNIFYPDLINKSITPEYFLIPCKDNPDFAILRFQAGPPYEDIAFKIVHREWEYSYKKGFRCQFHNNIFQLWFHFKRYRYRR